MAIKQRHFLDKVCELFTRKNVEFVSMIEGTRACGYGTMTLYRYFSTKPKLVVAVTAWIWGQTIRENQERRPNADFEGMTALGIFEFYLDSFIEQYRHKRDLLRFNQFFHIYIQFEHIDPEVMKPYRDIIEGLKLEFHLICERACRITTSVRMSRRGETFSITLHLMLAATRYAIGLVYVPEEGLNKELNRQVKNNAERFESDQFIFRLTEKEYEEILKCKNFASSWGGIQYLPYAFTGRR